MMMVILYYAVMLGYLVMGIDLDTVMIVSSVVVMNVVFRFSIFAVFGLVVRVLLLGIGVGRGMLG